MSVRVNDRTESKTNYTFKTRELAIKIGRIVMKKPKKYRMNYGDHLIKESMRAWELTQIANSIFMSNKTTETERQLRLSCLVEARGIVKHLSSSMTLFLDLTLGECDDTSKPMNVEKTSKLKAEIGGECNEICKMINGVIKSDRLLVV